VAVFICPFGSGNKFGIMGNREFPLSLRNRKRTAGGYFGITSTDVKILAIARRKKVFLPQCGERTEIGRGRWKRILHSTTTIL
jgi:hypothetical protein